MQTQYSLAYQGYSLEDKGILIRSNIPISIVAANSCNMAASSFLVRPADSLGKKYYAVTGNPDRYSFPSQVTAITQYDNTTVNITTIAGVSKSAVLGALQTWTYSAKGDLSGTEVVSDKPTAVIAGNPCYHDILPDNCEPEAEMMPVAEHSNYYPLVPFYSQSYDSVVTVVSWIDGTDVHLRRHGHLTNLNKGKSYSFSIAKDNPDYLTNAHDLSVFQLGQSYHDSQGDLFMVNVPPTTHYINGSCTFSTLLPGNVQFANIITIGDISGTMRLNGGTIQQHWSTIYDGKYYYVTVQLTSGRYTVSSTSPAGKFIAIVYGYGYESGYGYVCGMDLPITNPQNGTLPTATTNTTSTTPTPKKSTMNNLNTAVQNAFYLISS